MIRDLSCKLTKKGVYPFAYSTAQQIKHVVASS